MEIRIDDIPDGMKNMVDILGIDKFVEVSKLYGGGLVYIPLYSSLLREARNREIIKRYNGINARQLGDEYGISLSHVNRIIRCGIGK